MSFIIRLTLLLVAATSLLAKTVYFDPSQAKSCLNTPYTPVCNFSDPKYWTGGIAPMNGDDAVFPDGEYWMTIFTNIQLSSLNISRPATRLTITEYVGDSIKGNCTVSNLFTHGFLESGVSATFLYGDVVVGSHLKVYDNLSIIGRNGVGFITSPYPITVFGLFMSSRTGAAIQQIDAQRVYLENVDNFYVKDGIHLRSDRDGATPSLLIADSHLRTKEFYSPKESEFTAIRSTIILDENLIWHARFCFDRLKIKAPTISLHNLKPSAITGSLFSTYNLTISGTLTRFDGTTTGDLILSGANIAQRYGDEFMVSGKALIDLNPHTHQPGSFSMQFALPKSNQLLYSTIAVNGTLTMKSKLTFKPTFATPVFAPFNVTNIITFDHLVVDPKLQTPIEIQDLYEKMFVITTPNSFGLSVQK